MSAVRYARFFLALCYLEDKKPDLAFKLFDDVLRYVPEDSEVHTYYGRSLGAVNRLSEGYLHLAYAALYVNDQRRADNWLEKARSTARTPEEKKAVKDYEKKAADRARIMKEAR